ncbi:MAG: carbon starvation CstA 5TM domain-containing protein, partial [Bacteroides sp.]|nr:carbon starvation CstA 5TM domain-containing protein [Bacteroides sp.]
FTRPDRSIKRPFNNRYLATAIIVTLAASLTFFKPGGQGAMVLWPLFGSLNQLMAALALGVVSLYFHMKKMPVWYTLIPMVLVLAFTLWAMVKNLYGFIEESEVLLVILSAVILLLTAWLTVSSLLALTRKRKSTKI